MSLILKTGWGFEEKQIMNQLVKTIHMIINMFTKIATWTLLSAACFITIFWGGDTSLSVALLWEILALALLCAIGTILLYRNSDKKSKKGMLCTMVISFFYINAVILLGGFYFEWFYFSDWKMVLGMLMLIALGYLLVGVLNFRLEQKEAKLMNEKLRERNKQA